MDNELIQRWRDGDVKATTAVRNSVRSMAERVLSHSAVLAGAGPSAGARLRRPEKRRELTAEIAQEVMRRRVDNAAQLSAMSLMVAGRHAIAALQESHPQGDDAHLPPQVAVTYALAPNGLMPRVREAAERHLERCRYCAADLRILARVVAAIEAGETEGWSTERPPRTGLLGSRGSSPEVQADLQGKPSGRPASKPKARPPAKSVGRCSRERGQRSERSPWVFAVPAVALLGLGAWMATGEKANPIDALGGVSTAQLRQIADQTPPEVSRVSDLPPEVQFAVSDLTTGNCQTAAGRLRLAREAAEEPRLFILEAGSYVCAGDGRKALSVFDELDSAVEAGARLPVVAHWFRAQAHLLAGEAGPALEQLELAIVHDPKHRKAADAQVQALRGEGGRRLSGAQQGGLQRPQGRPARLAQPPREEPIAGGVGGAEAAGVGLVEGEHIGEEEEGVGLLVVGVDVPPVRRAAEVGAVGPDEARGQAVDPGVLPWSARASRMGPSRLITTSGGGGGGPSPGGRGR